MKRAELRALVHDAQDLMHHYMVEGEFGKADRLKEKITRLKRILKRQKVELKIRLKQI